MNYKDCLPNLIFPPFSAILILFSDMYKQEILFLRKSHSRASVSLTPQPDRPAPLHSTPDEVKSHLINLILIADYRGTLQPPQV